MTSAAKSFLLSLSNDQYVLSCFNVSLELWPAVNFSGEMRDAVTSRIVFYNYHTLNAMIELTISFPFSFNALTAFFLETFA